MYFLLFLKNLSNYFKFIFLSQLFYNKLMKKFLKYGRIDIVKENIFGGMI